MFPTDEEFKKAFKEFHLYETQMATKNYVLEELENYNNKEKILNLNSIESSEFSIEHIMPQTLSPAWKKALGNNYGEIYEKYIHTIGNLTLTGYNSEYSNKLFIEKRDMEKGFKDSRLHLNADLAKLEKWDEEEIVKRAEKLTSKALEIWNMPKTKYKEEDEYISAYDLSDTETSFIGEKIKSFRFDNHVYEVNSWKEFCENIARFLYDLDKIPFIELVKRTGENSEENAKRFSSNPKELRRPTKIDDDIYIETNYNTDAMLNSIRYIADAYSIEQSEIEFILKK
ncbi:MAG: HNH endonuclease family protein [Clostridia bacterium]